MDFRRDIHPEREIRRWRVLAHWYRQLTTSATVMPAEDGEFRLSMAEYLGHSLTPGLKRDIFRLLLIWSNTDTAEEALAVTLPFPELPEAAARQILDSCQYIPADFFGGKLSQILRIFEIRPDQNVITYAALKCLDGFKAKAERADVIVAVDWVTGDTEFVYGVDTLKAPLSEPQVEPKEVCFVWFAIDFKSEELNHLLAPVLATKGHYYYNGERHEREEE